jgi:hypothetical protein
MLFIFTAQNTQHTSFSLLPHYFLSVIPFFIFGASYVLTLLWKKNTYTAQCAIVVFLFWSLWTLLPIPDHGFTMTTGWNYEGVHKVAEIIKSEHPDTYNVVDILTGDTRAMAVRSLLTLWGNPPLAVDRYPESETLYIFSRVPIEQILEGEMWETSFITPGTVLKRWNIQNDVQLYAVKKGEVQ